MTKAVGTDTKIKTPVQGGKYRLFVLDSGGDIISMSSSDSVTYGGTVINNVGLSTGKWYTIEYTLNMENRTNSVRVTDTADGNIIAEETNSVRTVPENIASLVFRKEGAGYEINVTNITLAKLRDNLPKMLFETIFSVTDEAGNSIPNARISVGEEEIYTGAGENASAELANGTAVSVLQ